MVSVIIPAFNEATTIKQVILTAKSHPFVEEVIVVDDGSRDETYQIAEASGAKVIRHDQNQGKASAMETGVQEAHSGVLFFIDGDIIGLTHIAMTEAINSVQAFASDMYVLVVDRDGLVPEYAQKYLPLIGGVRVVRREIWDEIPDDCKKNFQIELALNYFARKSHAVIAWRVIRGLTHRVKENKRGILWGLYQRMFMIRDLVGICAKLYVVYNLEYAYTSFRKTIKSKL